MQSWLLSIVCVFAFAAGLFYLSLQGPDKKALYNGFHEAFAPMVDEVNHPFDPLGKPVDVNASPVMRVWPKNSWRKIPINDGGVRSIEVMGQARLQGRIYGVDLMHDQYSKEVSPVDISMGWKRAATDESFATNTVNHGNRTAWSWTTHRGWPHHQFSNNHLIPANWSIYEVLKSAKPDDRIALEAWPVTVRIKDRGPWVSDLNMGDSDCEILLITAVRLERPDGSLRGEAGFEDASL